MEVPLQMASFSSAQHDVDWNHGLERSLSRELELEKKLKQLKQNEQDLKLKERLVEQVASSMEEVAEVVWGRFLEADNTAEVLMGISKDNLAKLRVSQLDLSRSLESEEVKKRTLENLANQLRDRENLIEKLSVNISLLATDNAEVKCLREKIQNLGRNLEISGKKLEQANAATKVSQQCLNATEVEMEALRDKIYATKIRAESAEEKATHLTELNLELSEEVDFLKGTNDSSAKKVSVLEKQLRELDIQFQHSRALSGASQEQQNMLYSAIWDMETLIDELKQKVVKSESKAESAEERCVILSESNSEVSKELDFMRPRVGFLQKSLSEAALQKKMFVEDISLRSSWIMDTVMQLATERLRVQKQLISSTKENRLLRQKLMKVSVTLQDDRSCDEKEFQISEPTKNVAGKATKISSESVLA